MAQLAVRLLWQSNGNTMAMWAAAYEQQWLSQWLVVSRTFFLFFVFTHQIVCAGTTQWQPQDGDASGTCHNSGSNAQHQQQQQSYGTMGGSAPWHNIQPPDCNTTGSDMAAVQQVAAWPQWQCNGNTDNSCGTTCS